MKNYVIIAVIVLIVAAVLLYLYRAKKRGQGCIGCPCGKQCGGNCHGNCAQETQPDNN